MAERETHHPAEAEVLEPDDFEDGKPRPLPRLSRRHMILTGVTVAVLAILALVPPLFSVGRFRRGIIASISGTLGRPVRVDNVSFQLLPLPGFTLTHFTVGEDPDFGAEPVISAGQVRVRLRFRSLWQRRLEFSRIMLDEPSINLVHAPDGRWNVESILLQAARVPAAPTAQARAGSAPRFPYIEATNARFNVKNGLEKLPVSLTEADFALWLPEPDRWRIRVKGHADRTDGPAMDTGVVRLDGTLGRSTTLDGMPLELRADWTAAPLGGSSELLLGREASVRGELNLHVTVLGDVQRNTVRADLAFSGVRRAAFVPERPLEGTLGCTAQALDRFHRVQDLHCTLPGTGNPAVEFSGAWSAISSSIRPQGDIQFRQVSAERLADLAGVLSSRIPADLQAAGSLSGSVTCCDSGSASAIQPGMPAPDNTLTLTAAQLSRAGEPPLLLPAAGGISAPPLTGTLQLAPPPARLVLAPIALALTDARDPALLQLTLTRDGYVAHLSGTVLRSRLAELARTLPPLCEGMDAVLPPPPAPGTPETPFHLDIQGTRRWVDGPMTWTATPPSTPPRHSSR